MYLLANNEDDEKKDERFVVPFDELIVPEFVISLEATDEFLKDRIMSLPESQITGTKNSEEGNNIEKRILIL
jgi:adenylate kinase